MSIRRSGLIGAAMVSTFCTLFAFASQANAEPLNPRRTYISPRSYGIDELFDRTFFSHDREAFRNRSIERQLNLLFGPYVENEINSDAKAIHQLYKNVLREQTSSDPYLRTPDLPNPYNSSLLQLPSFNSYKGNTSVPGTEFIYQEQPPR
ncbi:hypothetical protein H6S82_08475 [Planktothrix sp. FACHB-1355]|uniref:Uncharacterized protein n=1 Tax=Aerosakkonema funiforme FACHB-1375 TaxID=2949571 RepID=A0A926VFQ8_9CYAN|nr:MULTISPECIES: hypothetical protein [Oscillatoriales]MBD2182926.1 hypothetical protein [Aerosakkonema funiforme FACHB-1375]MBD3558892.1 hypothetical protein [Planktothrix sp. FACHB-1355]